jgi:hypothetical protein
LKNIYKFKNVENVTINQGDVKDDHQIIANKATAPKKEKGLLKSLIRIITAIRMFL